MSSKPTPTAEAADLRALLSVVLDALTLPYDLHEYDARILRRADLRHDGAGQYASTPWCRSCVDNCRDGGTEHVCVICDPTRYGGERG